MGKGRPAEIRDDDRKLQNPKRFENLNHIFDTVFLNYDGRKLIKNDRSVADEPLKICRGRSRETGVGAWGHLESRCLPGCSFASPGRTRSYASPGEDSSERTLTKLEVGEALVDESGADLCTFFSPFFR